MTCFDHRRTSPATQARSPEDLPVNPSVEPSLGDLIQARFSRRDLIRGALGVSVLGALAASPLAIIAQGAGAEAESPNSGTAPGVFGFPEINHGVDVEHQVAPGYRAEVLIRWGDAVLPGAPAFDPKHQSVTSQLKQFGYNNDFIGFIPLPLGSNNSEHGLLCVNHEYTIEELMFPGLGGYAKDFSNATREGVEIEMACHGGSILEIRKERGRWRVVEDSPYARRVTALDTEMDLSGPAAGHERLRTGADPSGRRVIGTLNNCAGGITPWGTYLMAEENFDGYFLGSLEGHPERLSYERYGLPGSRYAWGLFHRRFDIQAEPNEANRFGWIVEVDPFDPGSTPVKRTALGRFKHEGAESIVNRDGRLIVYSGDDQAFEFLYRFVSEGRVDLDNREANRDLLDRGTLSVARLDAEGTLTWLPLVLGQGPLTAENGFASQADVLIETRRAATLLGATPLDRPEDVEPNPVNGKVYVMLTNNNKRGAPGKFGADAANPREANLWGHILELAPTGGDHAAETARWEVLVKAGNPAEPGVAALWNPATSTNGWFACPDNCAVDPSGRLWVATDQGSAWKQASGTADGLWALETEGSGRGTGRMFYRAPVGAELCGPRFTPDGKTLFVAVQHPGSDGAKDFPDFARFSTFDDPATSWPDFCPDLPPRPSVVVITKDDGGVIGS